MVSVKEGRSGAGGPGGRTRQQCCPPSAQCGHCLTLSLAALTVFLAAYTILGPIAAPGGTVFALLVLILLALAGGQASNQ